MNYLFWDFDGTLGYRVGPWSMALASVLQRERPNCGVTAEEIRPYLKSGFPWHTPDQPGLPNRSADQWWEDLAPVFEIALRRAAGLSEAEAYRLARLVRKGYMDITQWRLYDDTVPTLQALSQRGWRHVILSNHVPELSDIVEALGLSPQVHAIFNSAVTGFEKPNPGAFRGAIAVLGDVHKAWMIGDNPIADVAGAEAVGLPAILVRSENPGAAYYGKSLTNVIDIVGSPN